MNSVKSRSRAYVMIGFVVAAGMPIMAQQAKNQDKLQTQDYWLSKCSPFKGKADLMEQCRMIVAGANSAGRGASPFTIVTSPNRSLAQTRSGVFLNSKINDNIVGVDQDNGARTVVQMTDGVACSTWATDSFSGRSPLEEPKVLESFVNVYGERRVSADQIEIDRQHTTKMVFGTDGLRGAYVHDQSANAGIWAACSGGDKLALNTHSSQFFDSIYGSARRF